MITHILFDHDGVLVDTEKWFFEATREALLRLNIMMTFDDYKQHLVNGYSNWAVAQANGVFEQEIEAAKAWRNKRYQHYLQQEDIDIPGVVEVLNKLSRHFQMAVVTTSRRSDFSLIHQHRNLLGSMTFVLCREDYVKAKPDAEPYLAALKKFAIAPENAVVVEDSKRGLAAAEAAGIKTIRVHNEFVAHQRARSDYQISALQELPELLKRVQQKSR
ncbi:HAD family hydrolase [Reinekea marinisedimentorum]|uniref:phosphoglycolate phosphatase n=1 Tax=Reinekea marinisedimentorum TaxID=230495 RepID=A0A4R3IAX2_9GAMM|nr:HAD family phosphatase [Reinekea marinisedimentorum]TCS43730.1 HAD superfamily hydrolase (TIGR01509 family) [Reinekea marinisedimentorum]